jgi:peptide/nickel transport system substrate-binding protein
MRSVTALAFGFSTLALSSAFAANHTVTVNTVQIFGTIDPAKISDYTDYMASANLYDGMLRPTE